MCMNVKLIKKLKYFFEESEICEESQQQCACGNYEKSKEEFMHTPKLTAVG